MAKGDVIVFQEAMLDLLKGVHGDLSSGTTLKLGIVDNTKVPVTNEATPRWGDFSANEVATTGNYTANGETLTTISVTMVSGVATITADDVVISEHASGFTDGYYGIVYNDTATNDEALWAIDLGGPESEQAGDVSIENIKAEFPANVLTWETPVT
jgi:hypothetical protein